jgi:hypothetical protein
MKGVELEPVGQTDGLTAGSGRPKTHGTVMSIGPAWRVSFEFREVAHYSPRTYHRLSTR